MLHRILLDIHRGDIEFQDISEGCWRLKIHRKAHWILAALYFGPILVQSTTEWGPLDQAAKDKDYNRATSIVTTTCARVVARKLQCLLGPSIRTLFHSCRVYWTVMGLCHCRRPKSRLLKPGSKLRNPRMHKDKEPHNAFKMHQIFGLRPALFPPDSVTEACCSNPRQSRPRETSE
jgi:hypothetical protein